MIDFCLVGGGFIGPLHAANIASHPNARLRWVVDVDTTAAEALAAKLGGAGDGESRRGARRSGRARRDDLHAAAHPRHDHRARGARRQGGVLRKADRSRHERASTRARRSWTRRARRSSSDSTARFDPTHRALFDAIRAGEIGAPEMLVLSSRDPEISPPDYVAAMPYGIFYDTMIHDFDMVRWLTAPTSRSRSSRARRACWTRTRIRIAIPTRRW